MIYVYILAASYRRDNRQLSEGDIYLPADLAPASRIKSKTRGLGKDLPLHEHR